MIDVERQVQDLVPASFEQVATTTAAEIVGAGHSVTRMPRRRWPAAVAAVVVVALVGVLAAVVVDDPESTSRIGAGPHGVTAATDTDPVPSGSGEWRIDLGGEIPYPAVIADGAAVVVSANPDFTQTQVLALEVDGSSRRWSVDLGSPVVSAPVAAKGTVLLRLADDRLVALDATDGSVRWSANTGTADKSPAPVVADDTVYVGSRDGLVQSFALADGFARMRTRLAGGVVAAPTVADGLLLVATAEFPIDQASRGRVYVVDGAGNQIRDIRVNQPIVSSPAGRMGLVAFTTWQLDPGFTLGPDTVLQIGDRTRHWFRGNLSAPLVAGDVVAAVSDEGVLRAYSAAHPKRRLWTARVGSNQAPELVAVGDRVIATGSSMVAFERASGKEVWSTPVSDAFLGTSNDAGRVVAISRTAGSLAVVDVRDGSLVVDFALHDAPPGAVLHDGTLVWTGTGGVVATARVP